MKKIKKNDFDGYIKHGIKFYNLTGRDKHTKRHLKIKKKFEIVIRKKSNQKLRRCQICASKKNNLLFIKDGFRHVICNKCSFIFVNPILKKTISHNHFFDENSYNKVLKNKINLDLDKKKFLYGLQNLNINKKNKKILDIGCGYGFFLDQAKKYNWEVYGSELNNDCIDKLKKKKIKLFNFEDNIKFDCITMWTVLEHIDNINLFIRKIKTKLEKNGKIIINVPNVDSLSATILQEKCTMFSGEQHINHFSAQTLKFFLKKHNFKIKKIETLLTDFGTVKKYLNFNKLNENEKNYSENLFNINKIHSEFLGYTIFCVAELNK